MDINKLNLEHDAAKFAREIASSITSRWQLPEQNLIISQLCREIIKHRQDGIERLQLDIQQLHHHNQELNDHLLAQVAVS